MISFDWWININSLIFRKWNKTARKWDMKWKNNYIYSLDYEIESIAQMRWIKLKLTIDTDKILPL